MLRGAKALALPHPEFGLELSFQPQLWQGLRVVPQGSEVVVLDLLAKAQSLGASTGTPRGSLILESTIPQGAGLGSSAALCVSLARWLLSRSDEAIAVASIVELARQLEDSFHGKSSGMDVAVIAQGSPIRFRRGPQGECGYQELELVSDDRPKFTFHDTGLRASTKACVAQVEAFIAQSPTDGASWDKQMNEAAELGAEGLMAYGRGDRTVGTDCLARSMVLSHECFEAWGLIPTSVRVQREALLAQGARAARMTGAGGGGYLVALWP